MSEASVESGGSYIYVIGWLNGPQKIGVASDPERRRATMQTHSPLPLVISGMVPASRERAYLIEKKAHAYLKDQWRHGEWFDVSPEQALIAIRYAAETIESAEPSAASVEPWQKRAKGAGLSQKDLARLLGVADNTVSLQLRGKWQSGIPRYVKTVIRAWEMLPQAQREALLDGAEDSADG